jgi:hypothetical protein
MHSFPEIAIALGAYYAKLGITLGKNLVVTLLLSLGKCSYEYSWWNIFFFNSSANCDNCFFGVILILSMIEGWKVHMNPELASSSLSTNMMG